MRKTLIRPSATFSHSLRSREKAICWKQHTRLQMIIAFARAAQRKRSRMGEGGRRPDEGSSSELGE